MHCNIEVFPRMRAKVLTVHQYTKKSQIEIAEAVGFSQATVHRLIKKFKLKIF